MPYSRRAKYYHIRQKDPNLFIKSTFKNVPFSHTRYRGKKYARFHKSGSGARAIVGKLKKNGKWALQSILIPKELLK